MQVPVRYGTMVVGSGCPVVSCWCVPGRWVMVWASPLIPGRLSTSALEVSSTAPGCDQSVIAFVPCEVDECDRDGIPSVFVVTLFQATETHVRFRSNLFLEASRCRRFFLSSADWKGSLHIGSRKHVTSPGRQAQYQGSIGHARPVEPDNPRATSNSMSWGWFVCICGSGIRTLLSQRPEFLTYI